MPALRMLPLLYLAAVFLMGLLTGWATRLCDPTCRSMCAGCAQCRAFAHRVVDNPMYDAIQEDA